jgi:hypothetical protein
VHHKWVVDSNAEKQQLGKQGVQRREKSSKEEISKLRRKAEAVEWPQLKSVPLRDLADVALLKSVPRVETL